MALCILPTPPSKPLLRPVVSEQFDFEAELAVVIGRVDATEILVRGQAFDLGAVARNNVARFEVK